MRCCSRSFACAQCLPRIRWIDKDESNGPTQGGNVPLSAKIESAGRAQRQLLRATVRFNAVIFGSLLGLMAGLLLFALAAAAQQGTPTGLIVTLLGIFLPGYAIDWRGAILGLFWGFLFGAGLGSGIYWMSYRNLLPKIDDLVATVRADGDLPEAVLRLHGPSLGLAIGTFGALGLVATTTWLVIRGTAAESVHAALLAEILPGYAVSVAGGVVGAVEFFLILYALCIAFVHIYNHIVAARRHET